MKKRLMNIGLVLSLLLLMVCTAQNQGKGEGTDKMAKTIFYRQIAHEISEELAGHSLERQNEAEKEGELYTFSPILAYHLICQPTFEDVTERLKDYAKRRVITDTPQTTDLPPELVELLKKQLLASQNEEGWLLEPYEAKEKELEFEEVAEYFGYSLTEEEKKREESYELGSYLADMNQDGSEEIIRYIHSGGTAGYAYVVFYEETKEGWRIIDSFNYYATYGGLFCFEDKYYYVLKMGNRYSSTPAEGYFVLFFGEEGTLQCNHVRMAAIGTQKDWFLTDKNEELEPGVMESVIAYVDSIRPELEEKQVMGSDFEMMYGGAELSYADSGQEFHVDEFDQFGVYPGRCVIVDFDNDGEEECVNKGIWYPDDLRRTFEMYALYGFKKGGEEIYSIEMDFPDHLAGSVQAQLWFEEIEGKVYTFSLRRKDGSEDYLLEAYLIESGELTFVVQYILIDRKILFDEVGEPDTNVGKG